MPRISAIIITKNEEQNLPRCLDSLKWADQIVVLDSGSTDRTVEIARARGAEVFPEEWKGYTGQKNSALTRATGDWVVSLDADEEFSVEAQKDIRRLMDQNDGFAAGYAFRRKVFYLGRWVCHGDWYPDYVVRLWRRGCGRFVGRRVHESAVVDGPVKRVRSEIFHYTYRDLKDQKARMRAYAKLWAEDQFEKQRRFSWFDAIFRPPARFVRGLILKHGFLDGWRGWVIAWMNATEVWMKYRNLRDLWRGMNRRN